MGDKELLKEHLTLHLDYYHPGRPGYLHPRDRSDGVAPLWEWYPERALAIVDEAFADTPPPRYCGEEGVYQIDNRAWWEWNWVRGRRLWRDANYTPRARRHIPDRIRFTVYERDNYQCLHCGTSEHLSLDHIYPYSLGGTDTLDNLQTLCRPCNSRKGARLDANPIHQA